MRGQLFLGNVGCLELDSLSVGRGGGKGNAKGSLFEIQPNDWSLFTLVRCVIAHKCILHLIKPRLKKPLWVMQSKVVGTDFFISLCVQNIPDYKATLSVLASVCTIHSRTTFKRKSCEFS